MPKEILLYQPIYSYTAEDFIKSLDMNKGQDVCVRMNCPGGDVMSAIGMLAKYQEHSGGKSVKVDGRAASMAAYFCCVAEDVECLDVSQFLFHRAAFPTWVENDKNVFTDEMRAMLQKHNDFLRATIEGKIGSDTFKKVTGKSLDDMFSLDSRIDVTVSAKQAEKMGLVSKVIPLSIAKKKEINALAQNIGIAAFYGTEAIEPLNNKKMTIQEIKADATLYASLKAEILADEKDRIDALAQFKEVDPSAVLEQIISGGKFSQTFAAAMAVKSMSAQGLKNIGAASAAAVTTPEPTGETDEQKAEAAAAAELEALNKSVAARFGVTA